MREADLGSNRGIAVTLALVAAMLAVGGCGGGDEDPSEQVLGAWAGKVSGGKKGDIQIELQANVIALRKGQVSGTVYFPDLAGKGPCSGAWLYEGRDGAGLRFEEEIVTNTNPLCTGSGRVRLDPTRDGESLRYEWRSGSLKTTGTLDRQEG